MSSTVYPKYFQVSIFNEKGYECGGWRSDKLDGSIEQLQEAITAFRESWIPENGRIFLYALNEFDSERYVLAQRC